MSYTRLTKPIKRVIPPSPCFGRRDANRPVIVAITPEGVYVRPYKRVKALLLPWNRLIMAAADLEGRRIIAERKAARANRRRGA